MRALRSPHLLRLLRDTTGFTMTEVMVVISLVAIMSGIGYSGFTSWRKKEQLRAAAYQLSGDLAEYRQRAIEKHVSYGFTFTASGYTIFVDSNNNCVQDEDEATMKQVTVEKIPTPITLTRDPNPLLFRWDVRGLPRTPANALAMGSVRFSNEEGDYRDVIISSLGSVRIDPMD